VSDTSMTAARPRRLTWRRAVVAAVVLGLLGVLVAGIAVSTDALGAGDLFERAVARVERFFAGPVPDRPAPGTIIVEDPHETEEPDPTATPAVLPPPSPVAGGSGLPTPFPAPTATAVPTPERVPVNVDIVKDHDAVFAHELKETWCAPAGVQITLSALGLAKNSQKFQHELVNRSREWESRRDSLNGGWGPGAIAQALEAYGAKYEIRAFKRRQEALLDAARAMSETGAPVVLIAWRGAHTWVMTGYKATADPLRFEDAKITGAYIIDPWYPRVSSIWGPSDPAGTFQDEAEMRRNFLPWKRPEGRYPDRDGRWIIVAPTVKASEMG